MSGMSVKEDSAIIELISDDFDNSGSTDCQEKESGTSCDCDFKTTEELMILLNPNNENLGEDEVLTNCKSSQNIEPSIEVVIVPSGGENTISGPPTAIMEQPRRYPIFLALISILQAIVFHFGGDDWILTLGYDPYRRHEIWRFLTVMLVHKDKYHLRGNIFLQLLLGVHMEIRHRWKRIAIIYLASVIGGTLFATVFSPNYYSVGASGGGYGLLTAHVASVILYWHEMDNKRCQIISLVFCFGIEIGLTVYYEFILQMDTKVGHAAHFGGAVFGFLVSIIVLKSIDSLEKCHWKIVFKKVCKWVLTFMVILIVLTNLFAPNLYYSSEFNTNYEHTIKVHFYKYVDASPADSEIRKLCENNSECQQGLLNHRLKKLLSD